MLIDTKELFKCETCRHLQYYGCNTFCDAGESYSPNIYKLTAVDAVEVVRCKKCIHGVKADGIFYRCLRHVSGVNTGDFFCGDGERKVDETD